MDLETRRKKQQELMLRMVERKVRERARQLYDERGRIDGHALRDWVQAESEVLENMATGALFRRLRGAHQESTEPEPAQFESQDSPTCESNS